VPCFSRVPLSSLARLECSPQTLARHAAAGPHYERVLSFFESSDKKRYNLHPEFVDPPGTQHIQEASAMLCSKCTEALLCKSPRVPPCSIAAGVDYGDLSRIGIPALNAIEWMAIAVGWPYMLVLDIFGSESGGGEQPVLRSQTITFPQPAAPQTVLTGVRPRLPHHDVHSRISVRFVGPRQAWEKRRSLALPLGKQEQQQTKR